MARRPIDDPYVYPGTLTLRNWLGLTDAALLRLAEYAYTRQRTADAPPFLLTPYGFEATHRHLFGNIFPWAGQVRTVGLTHPWDQNPFAFPNLIDGSLARQFRALSADSNLAGLDPATFAAKVAHQIGELNAIHAFRDRNGRTMRLHLRQLAARAGPARRGAGSVGGWSLHPQIIRGYGNFVDISFDPAWRAATLRDRGLDIADAGTVFEARTVTVQDGRFDYDEDPFITAGYLTGRCMVIVWTPRDGSRRIIFTRHVHARK